MKTEGTHNPRTSLSRRSLDFSISSRFALYSVLKICRGLGLWKGVNLGTGRLRQDVTCQASCTPHEKLQSAGHSRALTRTSQSHSDAAAKTRPNTQRFSTLNLQLHRCAGGV